MTYNQQWRKITMDCQLGSITMKQARIKIAALLKTKPVQPSNNVCQGKRSLEKLFDQLVKN